MNFISKGIMTGRAKLSRIIQVKPYHLKDNDDDGDTNKENIDILEARPRSPPRPPPKVTSSPPTEEEDMESESLPSSPRPRPRRSRSLDRMPTSGASSSGRRKTNSHFDVSLHSHSLGSPELPPVFTTTYNTIRNTLATTTTNAFNNNSSGLNDRFQTAEFNIEKSPVKRRAKW